MKHAVIVGAGIVGLACAKSLQDAGLRVTVIDRAPEGDKCSWGNAAGIAVTEVIPASVPGLLWKVPGWMLDPLGPLFINWIHVPRMLPWLAAFLRAGRTSEVCRIADALAALNALVYDDLVPLLDELGLGSDLKRIGAVAAYSSRAAFERDRWEWDLRSRLNVRWSVLTDDELHSMEPELSKHFGLGVFLPDWGHIADPKRVVVRLLEHIRLHGADIVSGEATGFEFTADTTSGVALADGTVVAADAVVIAGGAWSAGLAKKLGDRVLLESERGYNTTLAQPFLDVRREIIFAEQKFVATPLEQGLRIGGAAEFSGLAAKPNYDRSKALLTLARKALPNLSAASGAEWMGQRPATPDSLPVIGVSSTARNAFYAFGHGHLGLTQAATTARLIAQVVTARQPSIDLSPFSPERFKRFRAWSRGLHGC